MNSKILIVVFLVLIAAIAYDLFQHSKIDSKIDGSIVKQIELYQKMSKDLSSLLEKSKDTVSILKQTINKYYTQSKDSKNEVNKVRSNDSLIMLYLKYKPSISNYPINLP